MMMQTEYVVRESIFFICVFHPTSLKISNLNTIIILNYFYLKIILKI